MSYAPGSQYIVVGGKAVQLYPHPLYTSRSWDKGVLTGLCLTLYIIHLSLTGVRFIWTKNYEKIVINKVTYFDGETEVF